MTEAPILYILSFKPGAPRSWSMGAVTSSGLQPSKS